MNEKYQGYTNQETWQLKLWIDNEQGAYLYWCDRSDQILKAHRTDEARQKLAEALELWIETSQPEIAASVFSDLLSTAISRIDWQEIAAEMLDDASERLQESNEEVVSVYSRKQAIEDGLLIDVTELAKDAGFKIPVALTLAAWVAAVEVPDNAPGQDQTGKLWDVLSVLRANAVGRRGSIVQFCVSVVGENGASRRIDLKSICGPGDDPKPVLTIMLPNED